MSQYSSMFSDAPHTQTVTIEPPQVAALNADDFNRLVNQTTAPKVVVADPKVGAFLTTARSAKSDMDISEFGTASGKEIASLSDEVLKKTTTGKMGEFGTGITQILTLTEGVNIDDLNIKKGGMLSSVAGLFKKTKVQVLAQFESTTTSIEKVAKDLATRQVQMRQDNEFLDKLYDKNMEEYNALGLAIDASKVRIAELQTECDAKKPAAEASGDQFEIQSVNEIEQKVKRWEKQVDRLERMRHVALLTAPEIRQTQAGNVSMVEKFNDLINTTIPAWKKQMSRTILALRQAENAKLGDAIDDRTNEFFKKAADLNHSNAIAVAKSSQRSVVDLSTLEYMQAQLIDSVKQIKQIEEDGREERKNAATKIGQLRDELKTEMLTW